ncbi:uncharacterized protein C10orf105 homolog [Hyperolius riggenbachi]|uniref:uncharacterized protein C10orf105 homolog n=1 Tax=Hyperolius riggenbachi TaxID=752182 RepID=UPI0035A33C23
MLSLSFHPPPLSKGHQTWKKQATSRERRSYESTADWMRISGKMTTESTETFSNKTLERTTIFDHVNTTVDSITTNTTNSPLDFTDPLPIIISLICIFLLLATCLIFMTLCKPAALDQSLYGPREFMPYHIEDASEPQLRLWKRLGSLRQSINSFRRSRPVSQCQRTCPRRPQATQDWSFMESTKM